MGLYLQVLPFGTNSARARNVRIREAPEHGNFPDHLHENDKRWLTKLNFQVLRRTMATLAQTKGGVKDVQGILGHSKADTTVNVYLQEIEAGVRQTLNAICSELTAKPEVVAAS